MKKKLVKVFVLLSAVGGAFSIGTTIGYIRGWDDGYDAAKN